MSKNVLITGGAGFIGVNLAARLSHLRDYEVIVYDNESVGNRRDLDGIPHTFHKGDLRDLGELNAVFSKYDIDAVVHLAADTEVVESVRNPAVNFENNVVGTFNLLEAMRANGVSRIVNASTGGAIIGDVAPPVHEKMLPDPVSPYGASKLAVEGYLSAYAQSYDMAAISLRFANVYGTRSLHKGSVVALFIKKILDREVVTIYGTGEQTRDYVYIDDLCDGIVAGLGSSKSGVYQLGTNMPTSLLQLTELLRDTVDEEYKGFVVEHADWRKGEVLDNYCDISKAKAELGYDPTTSLTEGLRLTWEWFVAKDKAQ